MKKFKKENKSKGNKVLRAREGDFLTDVSDVSDVSEDYSKYLNPLYPAFSVLRATGKALHKYSPQSKRTSFEEQAFKNAMGKMVQGIKVPKDGLKKTADAVVSVSPPIAPSTITPQSKKVSSGVPPVAPKLSGYSEHDEMITPSPVASSPSPVASSPASVDRNVMEQYRNATPSSMKDLPAMKDLSAFLKKAAKAPDAPPELAKAAGEIPKTKFGMKKFMQDYGQFIALGAMAGAGGKGGQIAAPIIAALPGLIEMMKKKKKPQFDEKPMSASGVQVGMAHGGSMKKSSGGEPPKKSEGGAIRKFKGGSMNTIKYKEGGNKSNKRFPATTLIPSEIFDQVVSKNPDAAKRMLGRLVYEQNFPSPRKSVKTSPRKYSPSSLEDNSYLSDIEAMGMMRNLEEAPDLPTGSSSTGKFITGIGDLPEAGPSSEVMNMPTRGGNRSIEDAIYSLAKDANIPASSVPKNKSGLKRFFSMIGKGLGIKKKSGSQDEGSQSLSSGGAIRKFKGGSMKGNTMDSTLTPKYAKGGDMPKGMSKGKMGKAAGEMPQHKKMAMGKPTPQSMGQKFAKGGAAKYASGGMCKGYGIAKKIRPTGPMN
jgi:hypothetical protein